MEGYLETRSGGISPLMLSSLLTKVQNNRSYPTAVCLFCPITETRISWGAASAISTNATVGAQVTTEENRAEADCGQPDALPDHRLRDLNGRQVGGLGMHGQGGRQADFQLNTEWSGLNLKKAFVTTAHSLPKMWSQTVTNYFPVRWIITIPLFNIISLNL